MLKVSRIDFVGSWIILGILLFISLFYPLIILLPLCYFSLNITFVGQEMEVKDYDEWRMACKSRGGDNPSSWIEPPRF